MKFLALVLAMTSFSAFANVTPLDKGDLHLTGARAEIVSVKEICPRVPGRMSCMAYGSKVEVKITMNGCLDRLGGYFTKFDNGVLSIGAINIFNKKSMVARCVRMPSETITVTIPYEGEVALEVLNYVGSQE